MASHLVKCETDKFFLYALGLGWLSPLLKHMSNEADLQYPELVD